MPEGGTIVACPTCDAGFDAKVSVNVMNEVKPAAPADSSLVRVCRLFFTLIKALTPPSRTNVFLRLIDKTTVARLL